MLLWGDPKVTRYIDTRERLDEEAVREKLGQEIRQQEKHGIQYWPIFLLATREFAGCCGLRPRDPSNNIHETGKNAPGKPRPKGLSRPPAR